MYAVLFVTLFGVISRVVEVGLAAINDQDQVKPLLRTLAGTPMVIDSKPPLVADLKLEDYAAIAMPVCLDLATRRWLVETGRFVPQCHPDYVNVFSPADLDKKIKGLSKADVVLVPDWVASLRQMSDDDFRKAREQLMDTYDRGMPKRLESCFYARSPTRASNSLSCRNLWRQDT